MKPGDLSTASGQLHDALKVLRVRRAEVAEQWNDSQQRAFDEQHVAPLDPQVMLVLEHLNRLSQLMNQARHECS